MPQGIILKGVGGFYYVRGINGAVTECKARGIFRNKGIIPAVGDRVIYRLENKTQGIITDICDRESLLFRPVVANATLGFIVCSLKSPEISYLTVDKLIISNKTAGIDTVLCLNKCDLCTEEEIDVFLDYYKACGVTIVCVSAKKLENIDRIRALIKGKISVFAGVSGSGKSSIIALLTGRRDVVTGGLSEKTQRGKNTTRHSELTVIDKDTYIMDTPGFSNFDLRGIKYEEIGRCYDDFYAYSDCRFSTCMHINEPDCGVKKAVSEKKICRKRYDNYVRICEEAKKQEKNQK